ncbi:MAG: UDP-3-O-(3-hydroxymyristoyl)glucosamine N-acyltransferase [Candidatus Edwardsbacteria bacterium]
MKITLAEITEIVQGELTADTEIVITGLAPLNEAKEGELTFLSDVRHRSLLETSRASAVIVPREISTAPLPIIRSENPYLAFAKIATIFAEEKKEKFKPGFHPSAIISSSAKIGENAFIGAFTIIEDEVEIGRNCIIYPFVYIGKRAKIGNGCLIYPNVSIREEVVLAKHVIVHCGVVLGADGFGYTKDKERYYKIPQLGTVIIEDEVEIGANTTIDRATLGITRIGYGTKVDNLVQIGHNVTIGRNCVIAAEVGIGGSTIIGDNCVIAGQAGLADHIKIGNNVTIGAQAGVTKSIPDNTVVSGYPARPHAEAKRREAAVARLPELTKRFYQMERDIQKVLRLLTEYRE